MRGAGLLAVGAALYAAVVGWAATRLPAEGVPVHFAGSGAADRFGTRTEALVGFGVLGVAMLGLGLGLQLLVRRTSTDTMNIPHKEYWLAPEREERLRRMLADDVALFVAATIVFLALLPVWTVLALDAEPPAVPPGLLFGTLLGYLGGLLVWYLAVMRRRYRPPASEQTGR